MLCVHHLEHKNKSMLLEKKPSEDMIHKTTQKADLSTFEGQSMPSFVRTRQLTWQRQAASLAGPLRLLADLK